MSRKLFQSNEDNDEWGEASSRKLFYKNEDYDEWREGLKEQTVFRLLQSRLRYGKPYFRWGKTI